MNKKSKQSLTKDDFNQILDRNITWIENCDTKTSIILGGIGVVFGVLLASDYVNKIVGIFNHMLCNIGFWSGTYIVISIISVMVLCGGMFFLIRVLLPKKNPALFKEKGVIVDSLIFFQSIAKNKTFQAYKTKVLDCTEEKLCEDIISQIYICSNICDKKFDNYKKGLILSICGFALFAVMMLIGIIVI